MRFAVLGGLEVEGPDGPLAITSPKVRTLLLTLLFRANAAVSTGTLYQALWGDHPPASAKASLHNHVTRLRRLLGPAGERLTAGPATYTFRTEPGELDLLEFVRLSDEAARAREEQHWPGVARLCEAALALWRAVPLDDREVEVLAPDVRRLVEIRQETLGWFFDAALRQREPAGLVPRLADAVAEFPFTEVFHVQLMEALERSGRQAEALEAFQQLRRLLVDELGIEPGPAARAAQQRILDAAPQESDAGPRSATPAAPAPVATVPPVAQLPRDITAFTGRTRELDQLVTACRHAAERGGVFDIHAIDGMAGIGKTAFAVHAAHRLAGDFPDGQVFLSLHAHTPGTTPLEPADALATLLLSVGVEPARIPADPSARAALWRSRLAGRRMLVLLDDAKGSEQVRPLLPSAPGTLVLVTSRRRLVALEDAAPFTLDVLPPEEAAALFVAKSGQPLLSPTDADVQETVRLCGYLPLAIQLTAARLRHRRAWSVTDLLRDLADTSDRLTVLQAEELSVAAAFDLSYRDLTSAPQQLFRRMGLLFGEDLDMPTAAALNGTAPAATRALLQELVDHHLVEEARPGRFRMHDLIREHARGLAATEPHGERRAAVHRLLDYYLHSCARANAQLGGSIQLRQAEVTHTPPASPPLADEAEAIAWLRAEHANLLAAVPYATTDGFPLHAVHLPAELHEFLRSQGHWAQARTVHEIALAAATASGDRLGMATALYNTGAVALFADAYPVGGAALDRAVALFEECRHALGQAVTLNQLGAMHRLQGEYAEAEQALLRSRELFDEGRDASHLANTLVELGHVQQMLGRFDAATRTLQGALEAFRRYGNRRGEANALGQLGDVLQWTGRFAAALANHRQALGIFREIGNVVGQAMSLVQIGEVSWVLGDLTEAELSLREALDLCDRVGARLVRANALAHLSSVRLAADDPEEAAHCLAEALELCRSLGSRFGEAHVQVRLGRVSHRGGRLSEAEEHLERSLELFAALDDRGGQAEVRNALGALAAARGLPAEVARHHTWALETATGIGATLEEARALEGLAVGHRLLGEADRERELLERCLAIYVTVGVPDAERVRTRLADSGADAEAAAVAG